MTRGGRKWLTRFGLTANCASATVAAVLGVSIALWLSAPPSARSEVKWLEVRCPEVDAAALRELTALELSELPNELRATVRCDAKAYEVSVVGRDGEPRVRRIDRTAAVGEVPERYLALELSELVAVLERPVAESPAEPAPTTPEPRPEVHTRRRGYVSVGGRAELGGGPLMLGGGAMVRLGGRLTRHLSLRVDALALGAGRRIDGDGVRTGATWAAGTAMATFDAGRAVLQAGAGARIGGHWIRGISRRDGVQGRLHGGLSWSPQLSLAALIAVGRAAFVEVSADSGWVLRPIRGFSGGDLVFGSDGPWVAVSFGVGGWFGR